MGNGNAFADSGRSNLLPLKDGFQKRIRVGQISRRIQHINEFLDSIELFSGTQFQFYKLGGNEFS